MQNKFIHRDKCHPDAQQVCMPIDKPLRPCLVCQAESVFWHIQIVSKVILESLDRKIHHKMRFLQIWSKPHLKWSLKCVSNFYSLSLATWHAATTSNPEWGKGIRVAVYQANRSSAPGLDRTMVLRVTLFFTI